MIKWFKSIKINPVLITKAAFVVLGLICTIIVGKAEVVTDGLKYLFLLPLTFTILCLLSRNAIEYAKDSFGLLVLYGLIILRYLVSPLLIALTGKLVPKLSTTPAGSRFAVFIMVIELIVIVTTILIIWKPINVSKPKMISSLGKIKLNRTGATVCIVLLSLLSVRGTIPNILEHLSFGPIFRFAASDLKTYDMSAFMTLKAFVCLLTIVLAAKKYYESDDKKDQRNYFLIAIGAALVNSLIFDARNRATMVMVAISSLTVVIYCFGKKVSKYLPIIAASGFLLVWILFSYGTINVSTEDRTAYLTEISRLAELYSNGVSTEAHAFHVYERIVSRRSILTYISEIIKSNSLFSLPGFWIIGNMVKGIPTFQLFFNRTLPTGEAYILPNSGLAIYSAGIYLGTLLDMFFHWLIVFGIYFFYKKKQQCYDVGYVYLYSYCEMICGLALMNNVLIAFSLLSAIPLLLYVLLKINSMGRIQVNFWSKLDK